MGNSKRNYSKEKKKLFISFAKEDSRKKDRLSEIIKKSKLKKQVEVIIVADRKTPDKQLSEKVQDFIKEADFFVPILTKDSMKNQWVNQEIGFAIAKNRVCLPIIDENIRDELKGFIHKELDLCFSFRKPGKSVKKCCNELLEYIIEKYFKNNKLKGKTIRTILDPIEITDNKKNEILLSSSFLTQNEGTVFIWAKVTAEHRNNTGQNKYIIAHDTNNGNSIGKKYQNVFTIGHTNNCWQFWYNANTNRPNKIKEEQNLPEGWHLFTVTWSKDKNFIRFYIDKKSIGKNLFNNWPKKLAKHCFIGTWSNKAEVHYFNSYIGPYKILENAIDIKNIKKLENYYHRTNPALPRKD